MHVPTGVGDIGDERHVGGGNQAGARELRREDQGLPPCTGDAQGMMAEGTRVFSDRTTKNECQAPTHSKIQFVPVYDSCNVIGPRHGLSMQVRGEQTKAEI